MLRNRQVQVELSLLGRCKYITRNYNKLDVTLLFPHQTISTVYIEPIVLYGILGDSRKAEYTVEHETLHVRVHWSISNPVSSCSCIFDFLEIIGIWFQIIRQLLSRRCICLCLSQAEGYIAS